MTATNVPTRTLNNGVEIPQLGFGVFRVDPEETTRIVRDALDVGYRHLDTAAAYQNEEGVGRAIADSGIAREQLFVTTKLWNDRHHDAEAALDESLSKLGLDYVDLYLVHWPTTSDSFLDAWKSFVTIAESGRAKAVGVSNHNGAQIDRLIAETHVTPAVNQIELHVEFQQRAMRSYNDEHGIATEGWFPLGGGDLNRSETLTEIAEAHGKTLAQVALRWHLQLGNIVFPKTTHRERMVENLNVFDFELSDAEMTSIEGLDRGSEGRLGPDPATMG